MKEKKSFFKFNKKPYYKKSNIIEQYFYFDPNLLKAPKNVYLEGYWQTEKYFKDIENIIRQEFTLKNNVSIENKKYADIIRNTEAVSIHIRRGDYISNSTTNQYHGVCSLDYYYNAIEKLTQMISKPHFYIFSDDIEWNKRNLSISKHPVTFIEHLESSRSYEDLWLMSLCKHYIMANSSFSWWGTWLSRNFNKIIIYPQKWFNIDLNTNDLIPESWGNNIII